MAGASEVEVDAQGPLPDLRAPSALDILCSDFVDDIDGTRSTTNGIALQCFKCGESSNCNKPAEKEVLRGESDLKSASIQQRFTWLTPSREEEPDWLVSVRRAWDYRSLRPAWSCGLRPTILGALLYALPERIAGRLHRACAAADAEATARASMLGNAAVLGSNSLDFQSKGESPRLILKEGSGDREKKIDAGLWEAEEEWGFLSISLDPVSQVGRRPKIFPQADQPSGCMLKFLHAYKFVDRLHS